MHRSVQARAEGIALPPLDSPVLLARGAACYRDHCVQCHGGPGVAPGAIGKSMQPLPGFLIDASRHWLPREVYWITRNGIKMSGMPAWGWRLSEDELWSVAAFVDRLPELSPAAYASAIEAAGANTCAGTEGHVVAASPSASSAGPEQARTALQQYACSGCHAIPGIGFRPAGTPSARRHGSTRLDRGATAEHSRQPRPLDPRAPQHRPEFGDARPGGHRRACAFDGELSVEFALGQRRSSL